jgi:formamidopyrimidine-DNA glycosylase
LPELPEVETVARQLAPLLAGRRVRALHILDQRLDPQALADLHGYYIASVERCGKRVAIALSRRSSMPPMRWLCVHLRMTGRLLWVAGSAGTHADLRHLRAKLELSGGSLLFYDARRFGTLQVCAEHPQAAEAGMDPLSPALTPRVLGAMLAGSRQQLKPWLMRQDRLVGIGNIYASEILFLAHIHPCRLAGALDSAEVAALLRATRAVLRKAIRHCGTTFSDFQDSNGESGGFQRFLQVYGRAGQPCRRCGAPIVRIVQGQRSTYFCPHCQPAAK